MEVRGSGGAQGSGCTAKSKAGALEHYTSFIHSVSSEFNMVSVPLGVFSLVPTHHILVKDG